MVVSDIFNFFPARGRGRGSPRRRQGGERVFTKNARRGGGSPGGWGGARGREGVCEKFGGGVAKYFFSGPKSPPSSHQCVHP